MLSSIPHRRRLWHWQQEIQLAFACWVLEESPRERGTLFEWSWVLDVAGKNFRRTQNKGPVGGLAVEQKGKAHLKGASEGIRRETHQRAVAAVEAVIWELRSFFICT